MVAGIFEFLSFIFSDSFLRRLAVVFLLPNVLVVGFIVNGLNHHRSPLWATLIGPYWVIEKTVFLIFSGYVGFAIIHDLVKWIAEIQRARETDCRPEDTWVSASVQSTSKTKSSVSSPHVHKSAVPVPQLPVVSAVQVVERVPKKAQASAEEVQEKALRDFIGGGN